MLGWTSGDPHVEVPLLQERLPFLGRSVLHSPVLATLWLICASLLGKEPSFLSKGIWVPEKMPRHGVGMDFPLQACAPFPRGRWVTRWTTLGTSGCSGKHRHWHSEDSERDRKIPGP